MIKICSNYSHKNTIYAQAETDETRLSRRLRVT
jgi:hypothetical protein